MTKQTICPECKAVLNISDNGNIFKEEMLEFDRKKFNQILTDIGIKKGYVAEIFGVSPEMISFYLNSKKIKKSKLIKFMELANSFDKFKNKPLKLNDLILGIKQ